MSEATYGIRICTYTTSQGRVYTNVTCGSGRKFTNLFNSPYVRTVVYGDRVAFVSSQEKERGMTSKVSDTLLKVYNAEICQKLKKFDGEYPINLSNKLDGIWVDLSERTGVTYYSKKVASDAFKEPLKEVRTSGVNKSLGYRINTLTLMVRDQSDTVNELKNVMSDLERRAEQIMQEMNTKEQELKKQEGILEALETALQRMKEGTGKEVEE